MIAAYTLCVFSENSPGVLQRISVLFTRRKMNIESLTVSETERKGISRFTIVIKADRDTIEKAAKQIRRIVEVSDVQVCENADLVFSEIAFFKIGIKSMAIDQQVRQIADRCNASIAYETGSVMIVRHVGSEDQIEALALLLKPYQILEFVRSGRIALLKENQQRNVEGIAPQPESMNLIAADLSII